MSNVLFVTSSLFGEQSKSRQVAAQFLEAWRRDHPGTKVTSATPTPYRIWMRQLWAR
jgi:FMN-dependent NADH-azoreductase